MEQLYEIKDIVYERRKEEIEKLSEGYFCGVESIDFEKAKTLTMSQWKTLCAKRNIHYITRA
jgi:exosome complex RNA-binding protein Rrp4